jgi:hypothetical protein
MDICAMLSRLSSVRDDVLESSSGVSNVEKVNNFLLK